MGMVLRRLSFVLVLLLSTQPLVAGTTGKITGLVKDEETGEPLPGVNVFLEGTNFGAATNADGYYVILNVPPGSYTLKATMIGYADVRVQNVRVNIDQTTTINITMKAIILAGEEVTVVATRPVVEKDVSASQFNIQAQQIDNFPVRNINEVISLQAGVRPAGPNGVIIRGGGPDQIAFMVDGFTLRDERTNLPFSSIALSAVKDVQVQTGGFSAEYGNIRSGVINVVTREGDRDRYSGTINIRLSPPAPKHFGPSAYDPNSYWIRPYLDDAVAWTGTDNGAWDEYTQRQYPSFEGWYAVSQRTLQDDDPNNDLTPWAAQRVFKWQHRRQGDIKDPDYNLDGGFGGPVPFLSRKLGDLRFFYSFRAEQNMYLIPLSRKSYNDYMHQLKFTTNLSANMKLIVTGLYGEVHGVNNNNIGLPGFFYSTESVARVLSRRSYIPSIMYATDYFAPTHIYRGMFSFKLTHTISPRSFYEISFERVRNKYFTAPNALRDTTKIMKFGNNYWVDEAPFGYMPYPSSGINGLRMGVGMSNSRDFSKIVTNTVRFNMTSQVNPNNQVKFGFEFVYNQHRVRYGGVDLTLPAGRPWSIWDKNPIRLGAYIQDKLEFKGLIANLGVRLDLSDANSEWIDVDPFDRNYFSSSYSEELEKDIPKKRTKTLVYISPRLGVSHPITDNSKLYFNYGHFRSMPQADRLYLVQRVTEGRVSRIGDPNNTLSRTVAYELGYEQNLFGQVLLRIAGYYKDVTNQPNWVRYVSFDSKVNYLKAEDNFYEDIRGFEISIDKRIGGWITGFLNYTYEVSSLGFFDKLRYYENPAEQREYDRLSAENKGIFSKPLPRPYFRGQLVIQSPRDFGPQILNQHPFGDVRMSFLVQWREGAYSTWTRGQDPVVIGIRNNVQWPDYFNVQLRLSKDFKFGRTNVRFYLDVDNLLNTKIFTPYAFSDGNDFRDYMDSLLWPEEIGKPLGYTVFGNDKIGDLRPEGVPYDPLEPNPNNDPEIERRNQERIRKKSYIDNPNLKWLYYLNPRDIFFGIKIDF